MWSGVRFTVHATSDDPKQANLFLDGSPEKAVYDCVLAEHIAANTIIDTKQPTGKLRLDVSDLPAVVGRE
jgi:hypothetical protein